jgi:hypothetical protein
MFETGISTESPKALFLKSLWFQFWIEFQNHFWFKNLKIQKLDFKKDLNFDSNFQNLFQLILNFLWFKAHGLNLNI